MTQCNQTECAFARHFSRQVSVRFDVLAELPAGEYAVTAKAAGLSAQVQNVIVSVGLDTTADFDLTQVEKRREGLTVTAATPVVDSTRDVLGEVVDQKLVTDLPLNGRDFGKLVALVPGATVEPSGVAAVEYGFGQFSINGNRDRSNNYTLDGTDNNDPLFNNSALNPVSAERRLRCCRLMPFRNSIWKRSFPRNTAAIAAS